MTSGRICDLGRMAYLPAWEAQRGIAEEVLTGAPDTLILVEHDPVMTLGANFHPEHLRLPREDYARHGIDVVETDRGGDVTYHGPNQLVIYPVFDIARHGKDLHKWMRDLEETIIIVLDKLGLAGRRFPPNTGVWVGDRKVAAIGVKVRKWVNLHGIALNCDNDLSPFNLIVPCGIEGYGVTSLSIEAGRQVDVCEAKTLATSAFADVFGLDFSSTL